VRQGTSSLSCPQLGRLLPSDAEQKSQCDVGLPRVPGRNELGNVAAIQAEYLNHGKACLSICEPNDLLLAIARHGAGACR
jgi:hypothetical protein